MARDHARDLERICQAALERPVAERVGFLTEACGDDDGLRREAEALLAHEGTAAAFLETPAIAFVARTMRAESPALTAGQQIGPYTIVSRLGSGGMGEVYRARDATLRREVAIKVLPTIFTSDPERLARFEREARVLASLNHPNIATIHGVEHVDGIHALILEVVEGETLGERLHSVASGFHRTRAGLPLSDALTIARQVTEALEAAHEKGIVHRDLKPANIKIRPDGVVKVIDFGLAKAVARDGSAVDVSQLPTQTVGGTRDGMILGTAGYMSPEQARGEAVDKRTDIWAFGCLLYEMLTGRAAFAAASITETLSEVLKADPDWQRLPADTPESVRRLLRRCLAKDRKSRLTDIHDARLDLDEVPEDVSNAAEGARVPSPPTSIRRLAGAMALLLLLGVAAAAGFAWRAGLPSASPPAQVRFSIDAPPTAYPDTLAISPDGRKIVYAATSDTGLSQLWLRPLDATSAQLLVGTEGGRRAFWSPDSRSIAFFADASLKRIDVETGTPSRLADAPNGIAGTWNADGTILFAPLTGLPITRVSDRGGAVVALTSPGRAPQSPRFLPDGRHFLYSLGPPPVGIWVDVLDGSEHRRLVDGSSAEYAPSGHLLYTRDRTLFAQRFDPESLALSGSPVQVAERVVARSVASNGTLVFRSGAAPSRVLVWFDRTGKEIGRPPGAGGTPTISPDGERVAVARVQPGTNRPDIWILDLARNAFSNLTAGPFNANSPIWSPDGTRIVFASVRNAKPFALYERPAAGGGNERLLLQEAQHTIPNDWSPDGRFLIYRSSAQTNDIDLRALSLEDKRTFPLVQTDFDERDAQFSPDGRWFAYQSNESGRFEIYLRPFPDSERTRIPISSNGGVQVRWRHDGKELFYFGLDNMLMAVPIGGAGPTANTIVAGAPAQLFRANVEAGEGVAVQHYAVSKDGTRFLVDVIQDVTAPITVVLNWKPRE